MKQITFGAYDGFHNKEDTDPETVDHEGVDSPDGLPSSITVPRSTLTDEHAQYQKTFGGTVTPDHKSLASQYASASLTLGAAGLSQKPDSSSAKIGVDSRGRDIYSNKELAANTDATAGQGVTRPIIDTLKPLGVFTPKDESKYHTVAANASSGDVINELDTHRGMDNAAKFSSTVKSKLNVGDNANLNVLGMYENWGNMSAAQKSIALSATASSKFTLESGKRLADTSVTPAVKGLPTMSAMHAMQLAGEGQNVKALADNWGQLGTVHQSLGSADNVKDVAVTAANLGLLGTGDNNAASPLTEDDIKAVFGAHVPQYGVGALSIDKDADAPSGYVPIGQADGRNIVIPKNNAGSSAAGSTPEATAKNSGAVYRNWPAAKNGDGKGMLGGNQTAAGLDKLTGSNPYSAGAAILTKAYQSGLTHSDTSPSKDNEAIAHLTTQTLDTLTKGVKSGITLTGTPPAAGSAGYSSLMKDMKKSYAEKGINSKQVGYQLANQAYAEGRIDETDHVAAMRSLDMVFNDDSYVTAQRLLTGRSKAEEIAKVRNG